MSAEAGDTYQAFEHVLEAYDVQLLDADGKLLLDDPEVRQGIIKSLDWYRQFYQQGYIPEDAVDWTNADNNRLFLNRNILLTSNASMSIPAAVRNDSDTYHNKLGIVELPNKANGEPMRHIFLVEQAVIFKDAQHPELAKDFESAVRKTKTRRAAQSGMSYGDLLEQPKRPPRFTSYQNFNRKSDPINLSCQQSRL